MLTFHIAVRNNVSVQTRRRIAADVALIDDGLEFLTDHQAVHIRPAVSALMARIEARRLAGVEGAARVGGGL